MAKVKKGQTMIMVGFTGIKLTRVEIADVTDKGIIVIKKDGTKLVFDKKTLVQTNAKNEKYANRLIEDDPDWEPALNKARKAPKKSKKEDKKGVKPVEVDEDDEEEDEDEDEEPVRKQKPSKKSSKKPSKKAVVEDEDDDDEFDDDDEEL